MVVRFSSCLCRFFGWAWNTSKMFVLSQTCFMNFVCRRIKLSTCTWCDTLSIWKSKWESRQHCGLECLCGFALISLAAQKRYEKPYFFFNLICHNYSTFLHYRRCYSVRQTVGFSHHVFHDCQSALHGEGPFFKGTFPFFVISVRHYYGVVSHRNTTELLKLLFKKWVEVGTATYIIIID